METDSAFLQASHHTYIYSTFFFTVQIFNGCICFVSSYISIQCNIESFLERFVIGYDSTVKQNLIRLLGGIEIDGVKR